MTATPVDVPEAMFTALRQHFNDEQMIELTATIAWENYARASTTRWGSRRRVLGRRLLRAAGAAQR